MLQVIPKWRVDVVLSDGAQHSVWISDNFAENVMRQVASMSFSADPLVRLVDVRISQPASLNLDRATGIAVKPQTQAQR